ncbi:hypothetical protein [Marinobacter sp.]|uniref:hypothetical protein n=1 Tax=Marinobacter sp. TaxID=50741 RepID=UPI00384C6203
MRAHAQQFIGWVTSPASPSVGEQLRCRTNAFADARCVRAVPASTSAHLGLVTLCPDSEPASTEGQVTTGYTVQLIDEKARSLQQVYPLKTDILVRRFGTSTPLHVDGVFSAAWQTGLDELNAIHDVAGISPLYYAEMGDAIAFATDLNLLLSCGEFQRLDPHALAFWTAQGYGQLSQTLYRGIRRLPPASSLRVRWHRNRLELEVRALEDTSPVGVTEGPSAMEPVLPLEPGGPASASEAFNAIPGLTWEWGQPEDFRWELTYLSALQKADQTLWLSDLGKELFEPVPTDTPGAGSFRAISHLCRPGVVPARSEPSNPKKQASAECLTWHLEGLVNLASRLSCFASRHGKLILFPWLNRLHRQLLANDKSLLSQLSTQVPCRVPIWSGFSLRDPGPFNLYDAFQRIGHGDSPTLQFFQLDPWRTRRLVPCFGGTNHEEATRLAVLMLSFDYLARMHRWSV